MSTMTELMVVAGEASGDQHASDLVRAMRASQAGLRFFGMGGPKLAAAGVDLIFGAHEVSVMGIAEVLPKLRRILEVMDRLERAARRRRPACAVLVDIPDFNLRLAGRLKRLGIPVVYYVSPMVWAWREGRVEAVRDRVDRMLCILPFEEPFYRRRGVDAVYVGSPVVEQVPPPGPAEAFRQKLGLENRPTLALLPGSRPSEIARILPTMAEAARRLTRHGLQIAIPVAPGLDEKAIAEPFRALGLSPALFSGRAPEVVGASDVAVVASGTAALEAALMQRPMVVVYRVAPLTALVGRLLLKVRHVSLPNLLLGRAVVPELLQERMTPEAICTEVQRLLSGPAREAMVAELASLPKVLGGPGAASRAAAEVLMLLQRRSS